MLTCAAARTHPALQAHLGPRGLAAVVAEVVVARDAEFVALVAVVVVVAAHPDAVGEVGHGPVVLQELPGGVGVDHAGVSVPFDQQLLLAWNNKRGAGEETR